jgi:hypothetical protein
MMKSVLAIAGLVVMVSATAFAGPVTDEERQNCEVDYRQYCGQDGLGSNLLRDCMRQHGKELSEGCIKALEDAGEVTKEEKVDLKKIGK